MERILLLLYDLPRYGGRRETHMKVSEEEKRGRGRVKVSVRVRLGVVMSDKTCECLRAREGKEKFLTSYIILLSHDLNGPTNLANQAGFTSACQFGPPSADQPRTRPLRGPRGS